MNWLSALCVLAAVSYLRHRDTRRLSLGLFLLGCWFFVIDAVITWRHG